MGGVVSDVVSGVGDLGQGIISGVDNALTSLDDAIPQEAKIAAAIYAASQGLPIGAEGSALASAGATEAGLTATDLAIGGGGGAGAVNAGFTLPAIPAEVSAISNANTIANAVGSSAGEMTAQQTLEKIAQEQAGSAGLLGSAINFAKDNIPLTLAGAGLAAKALSGSTPTSSTTTSTIDPEVKAAYLRNLEEARMVGAGLGQRQFAPYADYNLGMVQKYMNPYENQVVQNTLADIERARQGQISAEGAAATAARAFGGSRQGVTRSLIDEAALRNAGNLSAQLRQAGFAQAQNLGLSQQQLMQQYEQQKLDAARNLGLERLNVAQGALSLQPANLGGSTTTPIYRNQTASALGGALGGASLGSLFGGTSGAQYGALAGGLLGFL